MEHTLSGRLLRSLSRAICAVPELRRLSAAGDQDLAEAIRTAQDFGSAVIIAAPMGTHISHELLHLSDEMLWLTPTILKPMLLPTELEFEDENT